MKRYRFEFDGGAREAEGKDVVEALAAVVKEIGQGPGIVTTSLGWLLGYTEVQVVSKQEAEKLQVIEMLRRAVANGYAITFTAEQIGKILALAEAGIQGQSLLRPVSSAAPAGCHCQPGKCMAPVIMGRQMPCRDPKKAEAKGECPNCANPPHEGPCKRKAPAVKR